jgi:chromosome segregation ATPase
MGDQEYIEALEAEVERLEAERDALRDEVVNWSIKAAELKREVERLTEKARERERVWAEHVARREAAMDDDKRATVRWAERSEKELKAEVERLTNKLNENNQNFQLECQSAEIEMLRAEVERLREALTECLEYLEPSFFDEELLVLGVVKRARAALAGEGDEDG